MHAWPLVSVLMKAPMKLYAFDGVGQDLRLMPLAARRALDRAGKKLSLAGFLSLSLRARASLTEAGSGPEPDIDLVAQILKDANPVASDIAVVPDPGLDSPPSNLLQALGEERPITPAVWSALSALDRYALAKLALRENQQRLEAGYREIIGQSAWSSHVAPQGGVRMVRVSAKEKSARAARAESWVSMSRTAFERLQDATGPKGDVLATARIAGIIATKRTADLIPLCHPLSLTHVAVDFEFDTSKCRVRVVCSTEIVARTGVEMEALVGASIAALTVYDMLKSVDRTMVVGPSRVLEKSGGRSGFTSEVGDSGT